ncbi:hypothetical protein SD71_10895 [Cohnella kolymensis]|uniref:Pilus assembly protein TadE n=1 Tax=Cohnella kolymensis TaxID=1590652 RepID=A0ABR5A4N1_9BACL|nr:hypothetical protein SD71_10895 [Cohnella kolymensis]
MKDTSGSVTLEAAMIFPWVLMMTFALLLFSLFIAQGSLLYYTSAVTAERSAFNWSNSAKDYTTGGYPANDFDGLYWRLSDDALVEGLFGLAAEQDGVQVEINRDRNENEGASAVDKLKKAASRMPESITGIIRYRNIGLQRRINIQAGSGWLPRPLAWVRGDDAASSDVSALVVEPAEFVRSFDLVRYYSAKMKTAPEGAAGFRDRAASVLTNRRNL